MVNIRLINGNSKKSFWRHGSIFYSGSCSKAIIQAAFTLILAFCFFVFISGCMVGPDYERPETVADANSFTYQPVRVEPGVCQEAGQWWKRFDDPVINELVEIALANNTDIYKAYSRVLQAEAALGRSRGAWGPDIGYSGNRTRAKTSVSPIGVGSSRLNSISTSYGHDISISYITDLFGKLKRARRASAARLLGAEYNQEAVIQAVVGQVVRGRIAVATEQRLLQIAQSNIESWEQSLKVIERRYSQGVTDSLDVYLARENLAQALAAEKRLERSLAVSVHSLEVLLAVRPGSSAFWEDSLSDMPAPEAVPVGIPADLLDRRPDILAAEANLKASVEDIGVSIAGLYPDLTLTGSGGYRSDHFDALFDSEGQVYSFIMQLTAPIWQGGRLRADVAAAKGRMQEAAADYEKTILRALKEVEDALVSEQSLYEQIDYLEDRVENAYQAEELAKSRYSKGLEKIILVLETERRRRIAENELVLARQELFNTRVNLFLAIGGDWQIDGQLLGKTGDDIDGIE